jgi:hypothetical protein
VTYRQRQHGRLLEIPLLLVGGLIAVVLIAPHAPWVAAAIVAVFAGAAALVSFRRWSEVRRLDRACRASFARVAAASGIDAGLRLQGDAVLGGMFAIDRAGRRLILASPDVAEVVDYAAVLSVAAGAARALGSSRPSWYGLHFQIEGAKQGFSAGTKSLRRLKRWQAALAEELGQRVDRQVPA